MMNFPKNTEWRLSAKGNYWRKLNGVMLVVGGSDEERFWIRIGESFLPEREETLQDAKRIAERSGL